MAKDIKRTALLIQGLRRHLRASGVSVPAFVESLNRYYLHPDHRISLSSASRWLYGGGAERGITSESAMAIQAWLFDQKKSETKS